MKPVVLVADGDAGWLGLCLRLFATLGCEVETATDGLDCLEKLRRQAPGVLVLDLALRWGGADGVLAWLREEGRESVVILTGDDPSQAVTDRLLACPRVVAYFRKPIQISALQEVIRSAVVRQVCHARGPWSAAEVQAN